MSSAGTLKTPLHPLPTDCNFSDRVAPHEVLQKGPVWWEGRVRYRRRIETKEKEKL